MTANKLRGEAEWKVGDRTITLRRSFTALQEIEQRLGQGIVMILGRMVNQQYGIHDLAVMARAFAEAGGEKLTHEQAGELIHEAGIRPASVPIVTLLTEALNGPRSKN